MKLAYVLMVALFALNHLGLSGSGANYGSGSDSEGPGTKFGSPGYPVSPALDPVEEELEEVFAVLKLPPSRAEVSRAKRAAFKTSTPQKVTPKVIPAKNKLTPAMANTVDPAQLPQPRKLWETDFLNQSYYGYSGYLRDGTRRKDALKTNAQPEKKTVLAGFFEIYTDWAPHVVAEIELFVACLADFCVQVNADENQDPAAVWPKNLNNFAVLQALFAYDIHVGAVARERMRSYAAMQDEYPWPVYWPEKSLEFMTTLLSDCNILIAQRLRDESPF